MRHHNTTLVTGLVDGQLKGLRLWLAKRHLNSCPVCALEYRHQQHVRRLLQANPPSATMSDSAEFFWSKVKTEIRRRGEEPVEVSSPQRALTNWLRRHQFAMATATALIIAACGAVWFMQPVHRAPEVTVSVATPATPHAPKVAVSVPTPSTPTTPPDFAQVEEVKTPVPRSTATTFDSEEAGVTVIWVSGLPWTPDMNGMKTEFANLDT
ncbi:MAG TPA: hypothetical protein VNL17_06875 [Verrucomicrobiae bacterium]|nr:hypothetical protein [Verrucomicrobiae bacterium]